MKPFEGCEAKCNNGAALTAATKGRFFFTMETKKYTKKELTDAVVFLMQLYEIKLQEAVYDLDNDDEQLNKSLKKLMLFNMSLGKETYLESAMIFVQNQLNDLQNV